MPVLRDLVLRPARQMAEHAALALSVMGPKGIETLSEIVASGGETAGVAAKALGSRSVLQPASP